MHGFKTDSTRIKDEKRRIHYGASFRLLGMSLCVGFVQYSDDCLRQFDGNEIISGEKIVFSAFVNDAHVAISLCVFVRKYAINLVQLQRSGVFAVVHADCKSRNGFCSCPIFLFQITFALELFSSDAVRFVPVNFGFADTSV